MDGTTSTVVSRDGTEIACLTAGSGRALLLVHGSTADLHRWEPVWPALAASYRVTAVDRRGRGGSGDTQPYSVHREFEDVQAVAEHLAQEDGAAPDVLAHSFGAVCATGSLAAGAPLRRAVLYEPPSTAAIDPEWLARTAELIEQGRLDEALESFLVEVIGRSRQDVEALRGTPIWQRRLAAVATLPRECAALDEVDLPALAAQIRQPVLLLLGGASPAWAGEVIRPVAEALPDGRLAQLDGQGHMAIDAAPDLLVQHVQAFLEAELPQEPGASMIAP